MGKPQSAQRPEMCADIKEQEDPLDEQYSKLNRAYASLRFMMHSACRSQKVFFQFKSALQVTTFSFNWCSPWWINCQWHYKDEEHTSHILIGCTQKGLTSERKMCRWSRDTLFLTGGPLKKIRALNLMKDRHGFWPKVKMNIKSLSKSIRNDRSLRVSSGSVVWPVTGSLRGLHIWLRSAFGEPS